MAQKPREATHDITAFIERAKALLTDAGYYLSIRDSAWLRPQGAIPSEYKMAETKVSDHITRIRQFRGGTLATVGRGILKVSLKVVGPNENSLKFALVTSDNRSEEFDKAGPSMIDRMLEMLDALAAIKVKNALRLRRQFGLKEE